jgi:thioredoxin reductase (NADPH)
MPEDAVSKKDVYDVIIIGGGPAGLTTGIYTSRARLSVVLIEKSGVGGQATITDRVENYPGFIDGISGPDLVHNMHVQAEFFGMRTLIGEVKRIKATDGGSIKKVFVSNETEPYQCLSLIVAAGHEHRELGVPGEREYVGKGVSYCATCDGAFFSDLPVAVVGGGDVALQEAIFLTRFAERVYLIHRRNRFRATKILQERGFRNKKMEFLLDSVLEEIVGQSTVEGVRVRNLKTGETKSFPVNGVFVFIGWVPDLSFLENLVEKSDGGYIVVDKEMRTSREGIFGCGDCCKKNLRQIVTACGDGATAAFSAQQYVERIKGEEYI